MSDYRPVPSNRRSAQHAGGSAWSRPVARSLAPRERVEQPAESRPRRTIRPARRFPWRTVIVLALTLLAALLLLGAIRGKREALTRQREQEAAEYAQLVARHTVDYTRPWIEKYALENGIEPAFAAAVILRESSYNTMATSSVGARGLMQLMPDTFEQVRRALGEDTTFADMYDAETNIRYGCWYLGYLSRIFDGDPIEIACAYHAGPNNVKQWIMNYAADETNLRLEEIPMEDTRYYAGKVYDAYAIYYQHFYPDPA
ncbi:MAG: lytic transglycosylase domain-containing protein [Clostridia bacterium]|nr:lytic transglycosylase domain-containing protein [Clostridia bacterium]